MRDRDDDLEYRLVDPAAEIRVWANVTFVRRGRDEVMLDFMQRLPADPEPILLARVLAPALVAVELRDQLHEMWQSYTEMVDATISRVRMRDLACLGRFRTD